MKKIKKEKKAEVKEKTVKKEVAPEKAAEQPAPAEQAAEPAKAEETKVLTLPEKTVDLCIQEDYWEGTTDIYDPNAGDCKRCLKTFPDQPAICAARSAYLAQLGHKPKKSSGSKTPKIKVPKDGRLPQSAQIDAYIKEAKTVAEMVAALAERDFRNDAKQSEARITSHLKAIGNGRYCRASEMLPFLAYLPEADLKTYGIKVPVAADTTAK
ncbi:MAG: hypothetical protein WC346_00350 [Methanogenium sp.]|jgi:hypothetical protein